MSAYVPPYRRQDGPSKDLHQVRQSPSKMTSSNELSQMEPPSSYSDRTSPSSTNVLLQAHGDSFVGPLTQLPTSLVDVRRYSGATAKGLNNDESSKNVGKRLIACLDKTRPDKVFLQFGNVDINISSVYRLETKGEAAWDEKQFVEDIAESYQAFLETYILPRLFMHSKATSPTSAPEKPGYIQDLYLCKATLPVVGDDALPESHAKYQFTKSKRKNGQHTTEELEELELQSTRCVERVRPLIHLCGIEARRRMTADFNERLTAFTLGFRDRLSYDGPARLHIVDLNQHIRKEAGSDEVAAQYITNDPTNLHVIWENTLQFWVQELASAGLHTSHMPPKRNLDEELAKYVDKKEKQMKTKRQKLKVLEES